jgi:hypothetical protein
MENKKFYIYFNLSKGTYEVHFSAIDNPMLSYFGSGIKDNNPRDAAQDQVNVEPTSE